MTLLRLFVTISLRKINEDDLNERDDHGVPFSEQQYMRYISLFKWKSFDQSTDSPSPSPSLLPVKDQTSTVSKHNTEIANNLQTVKYTL